MLSKIRSFIRSNLYSPATSGVLNYFTLDVSDPVLSNEVKSYRADEFNKLFVYFNIFTVYNFIQQVLTFCSPSKEKTELFYLINSIVQLIILGPVWFVLRRCFKNRSPFLIVPYFIYYAVMESLAFNNALGKELHVQDK